MASQRSVSAQIPFPFIRGTALALCVLALSAAAGCNWFRKEPPQIGRAHV